MGIFDVFRSWHSRIERDFLRKAPYVHDLHMGSIGTRLRLDQLRTSFSREALLKLQPKLHAFHLGQIEGDLRRTLDLSRTDLLALMRTVVGAALYIAAKDRLINSDAEWARYADELQTGYMNPEHSDARKLGLGFSGVSREDPEAMWNQFVSLLKD